MHCFSKRADNALKPLSSKNTVDLKNNISLNMIYFYLNNRLLVFFEHRQWHKATQIFIKMNHTLNIWLHIQNCDGYTLLWYDVLHGHYCLVLFIWNIKAILWPLKCQIKHKIKFSVRTELQIQMSFYLTQI